MKDIQLIIDNYFLNQYSLDKVNINVSAITSSLFDFYSLNHFNECYIICYAKKERNKIQAVKNTVSDVIR